METHSSILAWRIPLELRSLAGCIQSMGHKELDMTERLSTQEKHQSYLSNFWDFDMDTRGRSEIAETTSVGPTTKRMLCKLGEHAQSCPTLYEAARLPAITMSGHLYIQRPVSLLFSFFPGNIPKLQACSQPKLVYFHKMFPKFTSLFTTGN